MSLPPIVIVDSDHLAGRLAEHVTSILGHKIIFLSEADELIQKIESEHFELIILEIILDHHHTYPVLSKLKTTKKDIPVAVMNQQMDEAYVERMKKKFWGAFKKTSDLAKLEKFVTEVIEKVKIKKQIQNLQNEIKEKKLEKECKRNLEEDAKKIQALELEAARKILQDVIAMLSGLQKVDPAIGQSFLQEIKKMKEAVAVEEERIKKLDKHGPDENKTVKGMAQDKEENTKVKGVTKKQLDEEKHIEGSKEETDGTTRVQGVTEKQQDEARHIKGSKEETDGTTRVQGVTEKQQDEARHVKGSKDKEDISRKVQGVTESIQEENQLVKGTKESPDPSKQIVSGAEEEESLATVKGITQHLEESNQMVKGTKTATDHSKTVVSGLIEENLGKLNNKLTDNQKEEIKNKIQASVEAHIEELKKVSDEKQVKTLVENFKKDVTEEITKVKGKFNLELDEEGTSVAALAALDESVRKIEGSTFKINSNEVYKVIKSDAESFNKKGKFNIRFGESAPPPQAEKQKVKVSNDFLDDDFLQYMKKPKHEGAQDAQLDIRNKDGQTPIMLAALEGNVEIVKSQIELGCNLTLTSKDGRTPLHYAVAGGNIDIINLLIEKGAKVKTLDIDKNPPIVQAIYSHKLQAFNHIAEKMDRLIFTDVNGFNLITHAAAAGNVEILEILVKKLPAQIKSLDKKGRSAFWHAKTGKHTACIALLAKLGLQK